MTNKVIDSMVSAHSALSHETILRGACEIPAQGWTFEQYCKEVEASCKARYPNKNSAKVIASRFRPLYYLSDSVEGSEWPRIAEVINFTREHSPKMTGHFRNDFYTIQNACRDLARERAKTLDLSGIDPALEEKNADQHERTRATFCLTDEIKMSDVLALVKKKRASQKKAAESRKSVKRMSQEQLTDALNQYNGKIDKAAVRRFLASAFK